MKLLQRRGPSVGKEQVQEKDSGYRRSLTLGSAMPCLFQDAETLFPERAETDLPNPPVEVEGRIGNAPSLQKGKIGG